MTTPNKATSRPWVCNQSQPGIWHIDEAAFGSYGLVATCWTTNPKASEAEANARLIVAAVNERGPLLELLTELLAHAKDAPPELQKRVAELLATIEGSEHG